MKSKQYKFVNHLGEVKMLEQAELKVLPLKLLTKYINYKSGMNISSKTLYHLLKKFGVKTYGNFPSFTPSDGYFKNDTINKLFFVDGSDPDTIVIQSEPLKIIQKLEKQKYENTMEKKIVNIDSNTLTEIVKTVTKRVLESNNTKKINESKKDKKETIQISRKDIKEMVNSILTKVIN